MIKTAIVIFIITLTSYSNDPRQTDSTPNIGAFNTRVHHCGIAVSRNLEDAGLKKGCRVHISNISRVNIRLDRVPYCNGLYVVNDRTHFRWFDLIDIFDFNNDRAIIFGRQKGTVKLLWCE